MPHKSNFPSRPPLFDDEDSTINPDLSNSYSTIHRDGGVKWREIVTKKGVSVILTSALRDDLRASVNDFDPKLTSRTGHVLTPGKIIRDVINSYRKMMRLIDVGVNKAENLRFKVGSGDVAHFYAIKGTHLGVRETHTAGQPIYGILDRLDRAYDLMEKGSVPRWISVPKHYAGLVIPDYAAEDGIEHQYLLIERIDSGITLVDILEGPRNDNLRAAIKKYFGDITPEIKASLKVQYEEMIAILKEACVKDKKKYSQLFTDMAYRNVLVQKNSTPVAGKEYSFSIIDQ